MPSIKIYELTCPRRCGARPVDGVLTERRTIYKTGIESEDFDIWCAHCGTKVHKKVVATQ